MPLTTIRRLFPDDQSFARAINSLLSSGDIRLAAATEIPRWRWRELFVDGGWTREQDLLKVELTDQGFRRIS